MLRRGCGGTNNVSLGINQERFKMCLSIRITENNYIPLL